MQAFHFEVRVRDERLNAFRLITGLLPPSFFGTRNKLLRNWLPFEWTKWIAPFLNIGSTSWLINSDSYIDIWAWCGALSWNGPPWKFIFNPDTHSDIFGSFVRISQSPCGKRFSAKGCTCFNWCIGKISGKCVFGKGELSWERFPSLLRKLLPNGLLTSMVVETLEMVEMMMLIDLYWTSALLISPNSASVMRGSFERAFCHCHSHESSDILP